MQTQQCPTCKKSLSLKTDLKKHQQTKTCLSKILPVSSSTLPTTKIKDFIESFRNLNILNFDEFKLLLNSSNEKTKRTQEGLFRSLLDILFPRSIPLKGTFKNKLQVSSMNEIYNENLISGGNKSDQTFTIDDELFASTCKNLHTYGIDDLDIVDLISIYENYYRSSYPNFTLVIIIPDKKIFEDKLLSERLQSNTVITDLLKKTKYLVVDQYDLYNAFNNFKNLYQSKSIDEIISLQLSLKPKKFIKFRFHQEITIRKTLKLLTSHREILYGHICRSGKSFIVAGVIIELSKIQKSDFIIVTTAPQESIEQFLDIFHSHTEFDNHEIHYLNGSTLSSFELSDTKHNIIICSKQFLQSKLNSRIISELKSIQESFCFIDESHFGGTSELSKEIYKTYFSKSKMIYITATFNKPICKFNISEDARIYWNIEDIKLCKNIKSSENKKKLLEKFPEILEFNLFDKFSDREIENDYNKFPELHFLTMKFTESLQSKFEKQIAYDESLGISVESYFTLKNSSKEILCEFRNENKVIELLEYIFGTYDKDLGLVTDKGVIGRYNQINSSVKFSSRKFSKMEPLIILCFLPCGIESLPISKLSKSLMDLIGKIKFMSDSYDVLCINSEENTSGRTSKELIEIAREKAKNNGKQGLIVLTGKMCSLAVSLEFCDIVLLLTNITSYDTIQQMIYRSLTESKGKKNGFVFDISFKRLVNFFVESSRSVRSVNIKENVKFLIKENLLNINVDEYHSDLILNPVIDIEYISQRISDSYMKSEDVLMNLQNEINYSFILVDESHIDFVNKISNFSVGTKKIKVDSELSKNEELPSGVVKEVKNDLQDETNNHTKSKNHDLKCLMLFKALVPVVCFFTLDDEKSYDFESMMKLIISDQEKKEVLLGLIETWMTCTVDDKILYFIIEIYKTYKSHDKVFLENIYLIKTIFCHNIGNLKVISRIVFNYMIPHENEKKLNAEISTPESLVNEMLDLVPSEFWKDKNVKILECCSGKGAFLVGLVCKLMDYHGSKSGSDYDHYKHILENQIYFNDINPANIYICKYLLDPKKKYKLNYTCQDVLSLQTGMFDLVVTNPPYQAPRKKENETKGGGGDLLWNKILVKSINELVLADGYLLFVTPSGWRKPEDKFGESRSKYKNLYKIMVKENTMIHLDINDTSDGLKTFGCGTRYDFYLIKKSECPNGFITKVVDEDGKVTMMDLSKLPFIMNKNIDKTDLVFSVSEECLDVLKPGSDVRQKHISTSENQEFKYKLVHSTSKREVRYCYSNRNSESDGFGISKIILGDSGIYNAVVDENGIYGTTSHCFAIQGNKEELDCYKKVFSSKEFNEILDSCSWSNYQIDWRLFQYIKKSYIFGDMK